MNKKLIIPLLLIIFSMSSCNEKKPIITEQDAVRDTVCYVWVGACHHHLGYWKRIDVPMIDTIYITTTKPQ